MRAPSRDEGSLAAVAAIRDLQADQARLVLARAEAARRDAETRLEEGRAAVRAAEQGWAQATASSAFDPNLPAAWAHALSQALDQERTLEAAAAEAGALANNCRAGLHAAQARRDAVHEQAREAARSAQRRREEHRLAAIEDQLNARRCMS